MKSKQQSFFKKTRQNTKKWWIENQKVYGGALEYRKCARPFDSKKLVHSVLKAKLGSGIWFTRSQHSIEKLIRDAAHRYNIKIKSFSIQKDHLHLLTWTSQGKAREAKRQFQNFLRFVAAELGRKYKNIFKRFNTHRAQSIWAHRPFTRLISWGTKSLTSVLHYIAQNTAEVSGEIKYTPRDHRLDAFLKSWQARAAGTS